VLFSQHRKHYPLLRPLRHASLMNGQSICSEKLSATQSSTTRLYTTEREQFHHFSSVTAVGRGRPVERVKGASHGTGASHPDHRHLSHYHWRPADANADTQCFHC